MIDRMRALHPVIVRTITLVICLTLAGCTSALPESSATPSPSVTAVSASSPVPSASPSPSPSAGPILRATAVSTVPDAFHYIEIGVGESYRLLLFDEAAVRPPVEVIHGGRLPAPVGPDVRTNAFSASADGRLVIVMVRESEQRTTYFVVWPETGEVRGVLSGSDLGPPVVTPDGQRIAYARTSDDAQANGVWLMALPAASVPAVPAPSRIVSDDPQRVGSPPRPLGWSANAKWLAISPVLGPGASEVAVVDPSAGPTRFDAATNAFVGGRARMLGPGYAIDWRGGEANVLVTSSVDLFGGRSEVYAADVNTGAIRSLYRPSADTVLAPATWHPTIDRFAVSEHPLCCGARVSAPVWVRGLNGSVTQVRDGGGVPWWSKDGAKLFATLGGDDSTGAIVDLLTGRGTQYCKRSQGAPPGCT